MPPLPEGSRPGRDQVVQWLTPPRATFWIRVRFPSGSHLTSQQRERWGAGFNSRSPRGLVKFEHVLGYSPRAIHGQRLQ